MRKPAFCICKQRSRSADHAADQRLCFRYIDSTIPLLSKSKISSVYPSSEAVQPGLCCTLSETPKTGFLEMWINLCSMFHEMFPFLEIMINLKHHLKIFPKIVQEFEDWHANWVRCIMRKPASDRV